MKNKLMIEEIEKSGPKKAKVSAKLASAMAIIGLISVFSGSAIMADSADSIKPDESIEQGEKNDSDENDSDENDSDENDSDENDSDENDSDENDSVVMPTPAKVGSIYKDGTYTGTGIGFQPGTVVSVKILNNKISAITLVSSNDTPSKYNLAYGPVITKILASQTTSVATVSGATYSSEGMMTAVDKALTQAKISAPVAKKAVAKKTVAKKPVAKKAVTKKAVAKKPVAKKPVAKKAVAKKTVVKKAIVKKAIVKKAPVVKKTPVAVVSGATK